MQAMIRVEDASEGAELRFAVTVQDGGSSTHHEVTVSQEDLERLSRGDESAEAFVERCFAFLLEREPKESILETFNVSRIAHHFPGFESEISS